MSNVLLCIYHCFSRFHVLWYHIDKDEVPSQIHLTMKGVTHVFCNDWEVSPSFQSGILNVSYQISFFGFTIFFLGYSISKSIDNKKRSYILKRLRSLSIFSKYNSKHVLSYVIFWFTIFFLDFTCFWYHVK